MFVFVKYSTEIKVFKLVGVANLLRSVDPILIKPGGKFSHNVHNIFIHIIYIEFCGFTKYIAINKRMHIFGKNTKSTHSFAVAKNPALLY